MTTAAPGPASANTSTTTPKDVTFRNYSSANASAYAQYRPGYPPELIEKVLAQHTSTGGTLGTLLDVGCGPGTATRSLAPHFQHAFGADPGASMIATATATTPTAITASGGSVAYHIAGAESLSTIPGLRPGSVDLITAATCAHWFDMARFYAEAAKLLAPTGSIAIWGSGQAFVDPVSTPHAEAVQAVLDEFNDVTLDAYTTDANRVARDLYRQLPMPWDVVRGEPGGASTVSDDVRAACALFDEASLFRREYDIPRAGRGGSDHAQMPEQEGILRRKRITLETAGLAIATASPVTRWREAHREQVEKGEIEDVVDAALKKIRAILGPDVQDVEMCMNSVILVIKKRAH